MRVKILWNKHSSPDGHVVRFYPKGAEMFLPTDFARRAINQGWAVSLESFDFDEWFENFRKELRKHN